MFEPTRREFLIATIAAGAASVVHAQSKKPPLITLTLKDASDLVRRKDVSPVELTEACLARIEKYNPAINAFITVTRDQALAAAREMETEIARGK
ncbi:MAG TPA: amidase family protein, partial [Vicinamibacterales bacterium]